MIDSRDVHLLTWRGVAKGLVLSAAMQIIVWKREVLQWARKK